VVHGVRDLHGRVLPDPFASAPRRPAGLSTRLAPSLDLHQAAPRGSCYIEFESAAGRRKGQHQRIPGYLSGYRSAGRLRSGYRRVRSKRPSGAARRFGHPGPASGGAFHFGIIKIACSSASTISSSSPRSPSVPSRSIPRARIQSALARHGPGRTAARLPGPRRHYRGAHHLQRNDACAARGGRAPRLPHDGAGGG
jgi:hypothetical protein